MTYDILLINAHRENFSAIMDHISIGVNLLAVLLNEKGYKTGLFGGSSHEAWIWMEKIMNEGKVRSIGLHCDYTNETLVREFSRKVKEKWNIPVFVGGPQTRGLDTDFLRLSCCDVLVHGEGEITLLELLESYFRNSKNLSEIKGISYLDNEGKLIYQPERKPIENIDTLPWPDYRLEKGSQSWAYLPVMTGRGCPYRCTFCYEGINTRKVRFRNIENVVEELSCHLERHPEFNYIFFADDTFTLDPKRVEKLCKELSQIRKKRDFAWLCQGHVRNLFKWPHMVEHMVEAGMKKIFLGLESGSDKVLSLYGKQTTREMILSVFENCVKSGVPQITGNIIIGGPVESQETLEDNMSLINELLHIGPGRIDPITSFLFPYPNTQIRNNPYKFGIKLLPHREPHGLEDIPLSETDSLSWLDLLNARVDLNRKILKTMKELYIQGKIPLETILTNYRLLQKYGMCSLWIPSVFTINPIHDRYYWLLAQKDLYHSRYIGSKDFLSFHPQRVFEIWQSVDYNEGYPQINNYVLSPLEYELLLLCSGKLRLAEIIEKLYEKFSCHFEKRETFEKELFKLLKGFEDRCLIAYSRF